eukprot:2545679-Amphidinium_carterae.2
MAPACLRLWESIVRLCASLSHPMCAHVCAQQRVSIHVVRTAERFGSLLIEDMCAPGVPKQSQAEMLLSLGPVLKEACRH